MKSMLWHSPAHTMDKPAYKIHVEHLGQRFGDVLESHPYDALVIHSGEVVKQSRFDDLDYPLRVNPWFAHWLPLREADAYLVIRPGARPALHRTPAENFWVGPAPSDFDGFWDSFDISNSGNTEVAALLTGSAGRVAFIGESTRMGALLGAQPEAVNPAELIAALEGVRTRKSFWERDCIAEANRIAAIGHKAVGERFLAEPSTELELHLTFLDATCQNAAETPYDNIVALGRHGAVLHHHHLDHADRTSTSLLIDAGATYAGYASDITRTWFRGPADHPFARLLAGIDALQQALVARVTAGTAYEDIHNHAHELLAGVLKDVGVSSASADELVTTGTTRAFFPHGLGHSLGVQVHDVGCRNSDPGSDNPFLRATSVVEVGNVFTIEPGCYFIGGFLEQLKNTDVAIDWSLIAELEPHGGIRIEDDVFVTETGPQNLTRAHL